MRYLSGLLLLVATLPLFAQAPESHVNVSLLADHSSVSSGQSFRVGIRFQMRDHWHTYWEHPGFSGLPPEIIWEEVPDLKIEPVQFPIPKKFVDDAGFITYGYDDEALLIADAVYSGASSTFTLKAEVKWLECKELCIPGSDKVRLDLKVGDAAPTQTALFDKYSAMIPRPYDAKTPFTISSEFSFKGAAWNGSMTLAPSSSDTWTAAKDDFVFFPLGTDDAEFKEWSVKVKDNAYHVELNYEGYEETVPENLTLKGVVGVKTATGKQYYRVQFYPVNSAKAAAAPTGGAEQTPTAPIGAEGPSHSFWMIMLLALLGGMVLNLMPCVLPVLSLKVLSFVQEAGESASRRIQFGWVYTLGIMISFFVFTLFFIGAKAAGEKLGVGFQFQNPGFVIAMCALLFLMGLSFFDVFSISAPTGGGIAGLTQKTGLQGAFFQGMLMTLLSTPCTAPGLGAAYFWAITAGTFEIILIFQIIAFGLAAPYLLLCYSPFLLKFLPKPGPWMHNFKISMGFLLMGTLVWLIGILANLTGPTGVQGTLALLVLLGFGAWIYGNTYYSENRIKGLLWTAAFVALGVWLGLFKLFDINQPFKAKLNHEENLKLQALSQNGGEDVFALLEQKVNTPEEIAWIPYSASNLDYFRNQNRLVFMDFTAEWCATCKVNEKLVINTQSVRDVLADRKVVTIKVDYTHKDDEITQMLQDFNRAGVPLYVIYPGQGQPIVLPEAITKGIVLNGLDEAVTRLEQRGSL